MPIVPVDNALLEHLHMSRLQWVHGGTGVGSLPLLFSVKEAPEFIYINFDKFWDLNLVLIDSGAVEGGGGTMGPPGLDGEDGEPGLTIPGQTGATGAAGAAGADGASGLIGSPGLDGDEGDMGPPGPAGIDGVAGAPGVAGADGAVGPVGPPGVEGEEGEPGLVGPPGVAGADGTPGATGADGAPGLMGPSGLEGEEGEPGVIGPPGATGADGAPGAAGADGAVGPLGPPGIDGEEGEIGIPGPVGIAGADGAPGAAGADGATGPIGPLGLDGEDGEPGMIGPSGVAGVDGTPGAPGTPGIDGAIGPIGPSGLDGEDGEILEFIAPSIGVSGHTILDEAVAMNARANLAFLGGLVFGKDDAVGDTSKIHIGKQPDGTDLFATANAAPHLTIGGAGKVIGLLDTLRFVTAAVAHLQDSGGAERLRLGTASPHVLLTGSVHVTTNMGIVIAPTATKLFYAAGTLVPGVIPVSGGSFELTMAPVSGTRAGYGLSGTVTTAGTGTGGHVAYGLYFNVSHQSARPTVQMFDIYLQMGSSAVVGTGAITEAGVLRLQAPLWAGAQPASVYGIDLPEMGGASVVNVYGIRIEDQTATTINRLLELGPATPYLRLVGGAAPGAGLTNLYLSVGANLRQVKAAAAPPGGSLLVYVDP